NPDFLWCVRFQFGGYEDETSYKKKGNIIADPLFVDERNHDFHLRPGSPAIDAGDKGTEFNDKNFPPSLGSKINDIGAFGGPNTIAEKPRPNHAPIARAGTDQTIFPGKRVVLDGTNSTDPDGDSINFIWSLISSPPGAKVKLLRPSRPKASFLAKRPGKYVVELVVKDRHGLASKPSRINIRVLSNQPPTANISEMISDVSVGDTITLYGSASRDPDGDKLKFKWFLKFKPEGSNAVLQGSTSKEATLQIDKEGGYIVALVVSDGHAESEPALLHINTKGAVSGGLRRVPQDFPTIQSAVDAAEPGDEIIVEKGHYKELLKIDKSVNLVGKGWPVIDGGSRAGNVNTINIFYLGEKAGKIEGFVITGGGVGNLGHGINIWDSSPEIVGNRITGNHHGIGVHGSPSLTGRTLIHGNLVYNNMVGIGNGKDSSARIFNNRVYKNSVVGIGCRGKAAPLIENNLIYENHIGIGVREVSAPKVHGNRIYNNFDGVLIGPISTIKAHVFKDIIIENNLVVSNKNSGISLTSFNLSKILVSRNTIYANNSLGRQIRAGGLVIGYPQPASFEVKAERNIIMNNNRGGLINYQGPDEYRENGASLINDQNIMWKNQVNYIDCQPGSQDASVDPGFVSLDPADPNGFRIGNSKVNDMGAGFRPESKNRGAIPSPL
ncbi:MAG: hypothetical protein DSZ23_00185, partial [Thermodesulfatator sp.]